MKRLKPHPYSEIVPKMTEAELVDLTASLAKSGQFFPGITLGGELLDGRSREEGCHRAGIPFETITWEAWLERSDSIKRVPPPSPLEVVLALNVKGRRHLNKDQKAMAAAKALKVLEAEARQRMSTGGKRGRVRHDGAPLETATEPAEISQTNFAAVAGAEAADRRKAKAKPKPLRATEVAAAAAGVSPRSVQRAKEVIEKRPDLAELIDSAKTSLGRAEKTIRRGEQDKQVLQYRPPSGRYAVIVTDVPWRYDDQLDGSDKARSGVQYPTMTVDEICAMEVGKNLAADDCSLWFWVTNAFLIDGTAARVLDAWGFVPKTLLTWRKVDAKGNDRLGAGHYLRNVTEHCILATRGKPVVRGESTPNIFDAPRRGHSEKPDEFFKIAERVTPAPPEARLELFARKARDGWRTSGAEKPSESTAAERRIDAALLAADGSGFATPGTPSSGESSVAMKWKRERGTKVLATGAGGGFKFRIERVRAKTGPQGFMWTGWPTKGHEGRRSSHPHVFDFDSVEAAKADAVTAVEIARGGDGSLPKYVTEEDLRKGASSPPFMGDAYTPASPPPETKKRPRRHKIVDVPGEAA